MSEKNYQFFFRSVKFFVCASLAFWIALFLFYFMSVLISKTPDLKKNAVETGIIEFIRHKPHTFLDQKKRKLPEKKSKDKPPPPQTLPRHSLLSPKDHQLKMNLKNLKTALKKSWVGGSFNHLDRGGNPLLRIKPEYPIKARLQGIEGWVLLQFSITKTGGVSDIKILNSKPRGIFEKSAIRAILKWKYKPLMDNGKPIRQTNQTAYINFKF